MDPAGLESHLNGMLDDYHDTGVKGYVDSLYKKRKKRGFAYTCKYFLCAIRGGGV